MSSSTRNKKPGTISLATPRVFLPLLAPARYKGAWGGRGSGKSHFFAEMLVERCLMQETRAVCVREVQKSLDQSVKRLIEDKIEAMGVGPYFRILNTHIECPSNDGRIIFQGMQNHTADSIKSLEGYDVAWVEEAQSLSRRSLDLLRPTIRKPGSELWFSWNPSKPDDPVDDLLRCNSEDARKSNATPPPGSMVIEANWMHNPFFPDVLKAEKDWDLKRDPDKYKHIWMGGYLSRSEARVFHNWRVDHFDTPDNARFYLGADWGFAVDPTVLVRCWIDGRTLYVDHEVYKVGCEIDRIPDLFDGLVRDDRSGALTSAHGMARFWPITADSARPETISYMQRNGYPRIVPAKKGAGSVEDGIEFLRSFDIVVHPRCRHTIDELTTYSYKIDPRTDEVLPVLADTQNHVIDALRYAVEALRNGLNVDTWTKAFG